MDIVQPATEYLVPYLIAIIFNWLLFLGANPGLFFVSFRSFSNKHYIFTTNICEKYPSSIRCRDSNPRPLERESLPITTRPGLPPLRDTFSYVTQWSALWLHQFRLIERSEYRSPSITISLHCWSHHWLKLTYLGTMYQSLHLIVKQIFQTLLLRMYVARVKPHVR